jgi:hypothetical protein
VAKGRHGRITLWDKQGQSVFATILVSKVFILVEHHAFIMQRVPLDWMVLG